MRAGGCERYTAQVLSSLRVNGYAARIPGMPTLISSLYRLAAVVLLVWFVGGAVASTLTACCMAAEPCCAASLSGQGCIGCATTPEAAATVLPSRFAIPSHALTAFVYVSKESISFQPWKPPD